MEVHDEVCITDDSKTYNQPGNKKTRY